MARRRRLRLALAIVAVLALAAALVHRPLLGIRTLVAADDAAAARATAVRAPADDLDAVLARFVDAEGRVDYAALVKQRAPLDRVVAALAAIGPKSTPRRYRTRAQKLAYYINAYNALVLFGVVRNWPITSVRDVHGPIEPRAGFGFFWALRFRLDGETVNLHSLENDVIRQFGDARIHAAINCASVSCPRLAGSTYRATTLQTQLDAAAQRFAALASRHVRIDSTRRRIGISAIFAWYANDFAGDALDWIARYARAEDRAQLARARAAKFTLHTLPYDWSLNATRRRRR